MSELRPGEIASHDGFYVTCGYSVFLRQGQAMPAIRPDDAEMEAEFNRYLLEDIGEPE